MKKKLLLSIVLFWGVMMCGSAQETGRMVIKGVLTDASTGEPLPFANIGVLGEPLGVASDVNGEFELQLPARTADMRLRFSVVGYAHVEMSVREAAEPAWLQVALKPVVFTLESAHAYAKSLVYEKMLKDVVRDIPKNYPSLPYNYEGYFEYTLSSGDSVEFSKEAIVNIYDSRGYHRSDVHTVFKELNYRFSQVRRSREVQSVFDGLNYFDDLLTADVVRHTRNVLDIGQSGEYVLSSKGKLLYEGDSVQVIAYEVKKPTLSTSGSASITGFSGEIYIHLKDMAVLKNTQYITASDFTVLGRNLIRVGNTPREQVRMTLTSNYKKVSGFYFLSGSTIRYSYRENGREVRGRMQYITTRVNRNTPEPHTGRMYYEDIPANRNFWDTYSAYFQGE
ncbi:MAG: carboxypeptidase-like regulatory domain-containing protein [Culturomica sp.]|jgi:hypothetical protein|nr:carboxypeptidase-like regulatory domain-containing protein [Culturomica sp.]